MSNLGFSRGRTKGPSLASWDLWDTLITRCAVDPQHVFVRVGELLSIQNFCSSRVEAETVARRASVDEVTLADIYNNLNLPLSIKKRAYELECELEVQMSLPIPANIRQFKRGDLILSDMYLPRSVVERIVRKHGIDVSHDDLYLSSELGKTKRSGEMFRYLQVIGRRPDHHTGDNAQSDVASARRFGIKATLYRGYTKSKVEKRWDQSGHDSWRIVGAIKATRLLRPQMHDKNIPLWNLAATVTAPLIYSKIHEIREFAREIGARDIFFLSRDGFVPFNAFTRHFATDEFHPSYIYASRRALLLASSEGRASEQSWIFRRSPTLSLVEISARSGVPLELLVTKLDKLGSGKAIAQKANLEESELLLVKQVMNQPDVERAFRMTVEAMRNDAYTYYCNVGLFNHSESPALIVDLGWHGSLQRALVQLGVMQGCNRSIFGYYLALSETAHRSFESDKMGCLIDERLLLPGDFFPSRYASLIETLFLAPHCSLSGFRTDNSGKVGPVLIGGMNDALREAAECINDAVRVFIDYAGINGATPNTELARKELSRLCEYPDRVEASAMESMAHFESQSHTESLPIVVTPTSKLVNRIFRHGWRSAFGMWREGTWALSGVGRPFFLLRRGLRRLKRAASVLIHRGA